MVCFVCFCFDSVFLRLFGWFRNYPCMICTVLPFQWRRGKTSTKEGEVGGGAVGGGVSGGCWFQTSVSESRDIL